VRLEKSHNPSALARAVVIIRSGTRVFQTVTTEFVSRSPSCTGGNKGHGILTGSSIVEMAESVQEEPKAKHHLRMEKANGSLRSYSIEVLGPRVGYPLHRGTNED
jgi:hypothetical protein